MNQERITFAEEIGTIVATDTSLPFAAEDIVNKIRTKLNWDFAALYRVERHRGKFNRVHQSASNTVLLEKTEDDLDIDRGILANTLHWNRIRIVNEVGAEKVEQYDYVATKPEVKSVMTIPITLNTRVRWIFHVESTAKQAFQGPDEASLMKLRDLIQKGLEERLAHEVNTCLLRESQRGIVAVGMDGVILSMNQVAEEMLGRQGKVIKPHVRLSEYAFNDHARSVLEEEVKTSNRRIELRGDDDSRCLVFATRVELHDVFDAALWFFTDLNKLAWSKDLRFLAKRLPRSRSDTRTALARLVHCTSIAECVVRGNRDAREQRLNG